MKNHYISEQEFDEAMSRIKDSKKGQKRVYSLIYHEGMKIKDAIELVNPSSERALEKMLKRVSKGAFTMQDLRRAHILNNPEKIYRRIFPNSKRKPVSARLRWIILTRDGFRCKGCGLTSRESKLHVDHINPVSKGGENVESNLQTLCALCNLGKSNISLTSVLNDKQNQLKNSIFTQETSEGDLSLL